MVWKTIQWNIAITLCILLNSSSTNYLLNADILDMIRTWTIATIERWTVATMGFQARRKGACTGCTCTLSFWEKKLWKSHTIFSRHDLCTIVHPQILAPRCGPDFVWNSQGSVLIETLGRCFLFIIYALTWSSDDILLKSIATLCPIA